MVLDLYGGSELLDVPDGVVNIELLMTASFGHGILLQHLILISAFPCVRGGLGLVVHVDGVPRDPDPGGVEDNLISELISSNLDLR